MQLPRVLQSLFKKKNKQKHTHSKAQPQNPIRMKALVIFFTEHLANAPPPPSPCGKPAVLTVAILLSPFLHRRLVLPGFHGCEVTLNRRGGETFFFFFYCCDQTVTRYKHDRYKNLQEQQKKILGCQHFRRCG